MLRGEVRDPTQPWRLGEAPRSPDCSSDAGDDQPGQAGEEQPLEQGDGAVELWGGGCLARLRGSAVLGVAMTELAGRLQMRRSPGPWPWGGGAC